MNKFGLAIGINDYPGSGNDLSGCVNDAMDMAALMNSRGFSSVHTLLDGEATKANILASLRALVAQMQFRDTLVVHNSSHGTWVPDQNGDEADGRDECWVAYDFQNGGIIRDDDLFDVFSQRPWGTRVMVLSDSCFSGGVTRYFEPLPNVDKRRFLPPGQFLDGSELERAHRAVNAPAKGVSRNSGVLISGCSAYEYSYDTSFNGRPNGAFTRAAIDTCWPDMTVAQWYAAIRKRLPSADYPQTPGLTATYWQKRWRVM